VFFAPSRSPIHEILPGDMYTFGGERMDRAPERFDAPVRGIVEGLPLFAHHPLKGEGARYDGLPDVIPDYRTAQGRIGDRHCPLLFF